MVMQTEKNEVLSNSSEVREFTIAGTDNIFETLSSRLYTNPKRAIIRETVSNAIDANIMAGVNEKIKLHLPTSLEPEFYVEDHGIGMDEDTIYNVYTQYGNSTKNGSNNCIGGLGLGSKTPFAYTSQFFVSSAKDGIRNSYVCFKNEDGKPSITKTDSVACSETGTKVSFPVEARDIQAFTAEAVITLLFTMQMPQILGDEDAFCYRAGVESITEFEQLREYVKNNTFISNDKVRNIINRSSYDSDFLVEMGGVAYSVDTAELLDGDRWNSILKYFTNKSDYIIFHLNIGDVAIQSSREALQYTERTKKALNQTLIRQFFSKVQEVVAA